MTSLCDEIWLAMRHQGVKLKDIANEADIDPASVSLALRNKTAISPRVALAVETLTDISVEYIFERQAEVYVARKLTQVDAIRKEKADLLAAIAEAAE